MIEPYYSKNNVTIYNADWHDVIDELPHFDLLLADPPYGISVLDGYQGRANRKSGKAQVKGTDWGEGDWDETAPPKEDFDKLISKSTNQIIWGGNYFGLPASSCWFVWDKENGENLYADCELAWTNFESAVRLFKYKWHGFIQADMKNKEKRVHPCHKPLALFKFCIEKSPKSVKTIFDPYMGGGGSLVAALSYQLKENRVIQAVGCEREEKYCEVAVKRLEELNEKIVTRKNDEDWIS